MNVNMKHSRLGLSLIIAAIAAIVVLIAISSIKKHESMVQQVREQGMGVVRSLSALPLDVLVTRGAEIGVLHSLFTFYKPEHFAYAAITSLDGRTIAEVVKPGMLTPSLTYVPDQAQPFREHLFEAGLDTKKIREFSGPLATPDGEQMLIRVGYHEPGIAFGGEDLSFFGMLALPTFLIVPLFYFLLARELKPLRSAYQKLSTVFEEKRSTAIPLSQEVDLQNFTQRVISYIQDSNSEMKVLEREKLDLLTRNRLLEYGNNKLNFVLQSLPEGLLVLDPAGHITFASNKVEAMLGVDLPTVMSGRVEDWCENDAFRGLLLRFQTGGIHGMRAETLEFHPRPQQDKRIRTIVKPLIAANEGPAFGSLVVLQDMTREHLGQCASQSFVAHVSHELKSPLNVIAMYCEMLRDGGAGNEAMRIEATNVIHDEVERMNGLVNNLLNISKIEVGGFKPQTTRVKVDDFLQDIFNHALPKAELNQVRMQLTVAREIASISADKDMLRIAINNIVSNAIKYSQEGGQVTLGAREDNGNLVIEVQDNGIGIPVDEQAGVFQKFVRAKGANTHTRNGHGLGLYLANEIVQLHHGKITLESAPDKGSRFSIHLKAATSNELNLV